MMVNEAYKSLAYSQFVPYFFDESMAWQASFTELPSSLVEALKITSPS
jgi:hypothetical protein